MDQRFDLSDPAARRRYLERQLGTPLSPDGQYAVYVVSTGVRKSRWINRAQAMNLCNILNRTRLDYEVRGSDGRTI